MAENKITNPDHPDHPLHGLANERKARERRERATRGESIVAHTDECSTCRRNLTLATLGHHTPGRCEVLAGLLDRSITADGQTGHEPLDSGSEREATPAEGGEG